MYFPRNREFLQISPVFIQEIMRCLILNNLPKLIGDRDQKAAIPTAAHYRRSSKRLLLNPDGLAVERMRSFAVIGRNKTAFLPVEQNEIITFYLLANSKILHLQFMVVGSGTGLFQPGSKNIVKDPQWTLGSLMGT